MVQPLPAPAHALPSERAQKARPREITVESYNSSAKRRKITLQPSERSVAAKQNEDNCMLQKAAACE